MDASPSRTALMSAVMRGRHRLEDAWPWILDDPFALLLIGPSWRDLVDSSRSRMSDELSRQVRASIAVRSRYAEQRFERGAFRQLVLLGAGLGSFAWRRPDLLRSRRVLEVDHPASQAWKCERAAELGLSTSGHHVFAPVDFEVQSLRSGLDAAHFDWTEPALFSWLGVVPYLTTDAIEDTLRTVASCSPGSEIAFEYGVTDSFLDDIGREFGGVFAPLASRVGEPVRTRWSPVEADAFVSRCRLRVVEHPGRDELISRYFAGRSDGLRPWSVSRLLTATVV